MLTALARALEVDALEVVGTTGAVVSRLGPPLTGRFERLVLRDAGEPVGELHLDLPRDRRPRLLLAALLPHVATVLHAGLLAADLRRERERVLAARRAERDRLRHDLHDGLGPALSGISLGVQAAGRALAADPALAERLLPRFRADAGAALVEVRRVLNRLRPADLDDSDLPAALRRRLAALGLDGLGIGDAAQLDVELEALPAEVEEAAYRIVSEALNNIVRHAGRVPTQVRLRHREGSLEVLVRDAGPGLPSHRRDGLGLQSIRLRAEQLGGSAEVGPAADGGTQVRVAIPLGCER